MTNQPERIYVGGLGHVVLDEPEPATTEGNSDVPVTQPQEAPNASN